MKKELIRIAYESIKKQKPWRHEKSEMLHHRVLPYATFAPWLNDYEFINFYNLYSKIKIIEGAKEYLSQRIVPDATYRNWNSYSAETGFEKGVNVMEAFNLLPDPQTNGGLLFSVHENTIQEVVELLSLNGYHDFIEPIGRFTEKKDKTIEVKN
jgi:hypothetical protein